MSDPTRGDAGELAPPFAACINDYLDARQLADLDPEAFAGRIRRILDECPGEYREALLVFLASEGVPDALLDPLLAEGTELSIRASYRILGHHDSGGMGHVYLAHDATLGRTVALKVMRTVASGVWCDAPEDRDQFLGEASITAGLGHPSVPAVYGAAGGEGAGPTFYAMRLVEEARTMLDAIGELHRGGPRDRAFASARSRHLVRYLQGVCEAVGQAHARGFVHRDLKPDNIALDEGGQRAWVLDWGLARRQDWSPRSGPESDQNRLYGTIAGTLPYMSPEQASGRGPIEPASDVYSLGAILYHILAGSVPFSTGPGEAAASFLDMQAKILEGKLRPPSAINRSTPDRLERICRKAMDREPGRRFASADEMAVELARWLDDEPPLEVAEPPLEKAYRLAIKRYPERFAGGAAVLLAMSVVIAAWSYARAVEADAETARIRGEAERDAEIARVTKIEGDRAQKAYSFLDEDMQSARLGQGLNPGVTLVQALDLAVPRIDARFANDPDGMARVCLIVANKYRFAGSYPRAEPLARRAVEIRGRIFGSGDRRTILATTDLASIVGESGRLAEAEPMIRSNLGDCRKVFGENDINTSASMAHLAALLCERARRISLGSAMPPQLAGTDPNRVIEDAWDEAESLLRRAVDIQGAIEGEGSPRTLATTNNLAILLLDRQKYGDAEAYLRRANGVCEKTLGVEHPITISVVNNLATLRIQRGEISGAELDRNLDAARWVMGRSHRLTRTALTNILTANLNPDDPASLAKAEPCARELWHLNKDETGGDPVETLAALEVYAKILQHQGRHREAEPLLAELIGRRRTGNHPPQSIGLALQAHGWSLLEIGEPAAAERELSEARTIFRSLGANGALFSALAESGLCDCLTTSGHFEDAEMMGTSSWPVIEASPLLSRTVKLRAIGRVIRLYRTWGKTDLASSWEAKRDTLTPIGTR